MEQRTEQNVFLYSRSKLEISGVCDVFELTEGSVELTLEDGCMGIDGEELRIDYFNCESKKVLIHGTINGICYYKKSGTKKKNKKHV